MQLLSITFRSTDHPLFHSPFLKRPYLRPSPLSHLVPPQRRRLPVPPRPSLRSPPLTLLYTGHQQRHPHHPYRTQIRPQRVYATPYYTRSGPPTRHCHSHHTRFTTLRQFLFTLHTRAIVQRKTNVTKTSQTLIYVLHLTVFLFERPRYSLCTLIRYPGQGQP